LACSCLGVTPRTITVAASSTTVTASETSTSCSIADLVVTIQTTTETLSATATTTTVAVASAIAATDKFYFKIVGTTLFPASAGQITRTYEYPLAYENAPLFSQLNRAAGPATPLLKRVLQLFLLALRLPTYRGRGAERARYAPNIRRGSVASATCLLCLACAVEAYPRAP